MKTTTDKAQLFALDTTRPLAGRTEQHTLKEWRRIYNYTAERLAMDGAKLVPVHEPPATRHSLTGAEAVKIVSDVRAILWRDPIAVSENARCADMFASEKEHTLDSLDAIVGTLEDAGLAPTAPEPFREITLAAAEIEEPSVADDHSAKDQPPYSPLTCELCHTTVNGIPWPNGWDLCWQCAVCPGCQARCAADGVALSNARGGCYAEGRPDPRAVDQSQVLRAIHAIEYGQSAVDAYLRESATPGPAQTYAAVDAVAAHPYGAFLVTEAPHTTPEQLYAAAVGAYSAATTIEHFLSVQANYERAKAIIAGREAVQ